MSNNIRDKDVTFFNYIEYHKDSYTLEFYDSASQFNYEIIQKKDNYFLIKLNRYDSEYFIQETENGNIRFWQIIRDFTEEEALHFLEKWDKEHENKYKLNKN